MKLIEVISVKFKDKGKVYFFAANGVTADAGDHVVVQTSKGLEYAECTCGNHFVDDNTVIPPLRPVMRVATEADDRRARDNKRREKEAFDYCQKRILSHKLDMKLVDVECNFEGNKMLFFFTSEGRVDFRDLVKDLGACSRPAWSSGRSASGTRPGCWAGSASAGGPSAAPSS
jgi:cell fate regulator YaaT (PSP1 superfamily)